MQYYVSIVLAQTNIAKRRPTPATIWPSHLFYVFD